MADPAPLVVLPAALGVLLHGVHCGLDGFVLAPHLVVCLDGALVVQPHQRADVQHRGNGRRRAGHPACAPELGHIGREELVVHLVAVVQHPLGRLVQRRTGVPHVSHRVHQQSVAGGRAQGVDHHQLPVGVLLPQHVRREERVMHRAGLAGRERNVQHVALLQQALEKLLVLCFVDLAGLGQLALPDELIEPGQRLRIAPHVVVIRHAIHHVGIEQHRDMAALQIAVGNIHCGAAAQNKFIRHRDSPFSTRIIADFTILSIIQYTKKCNARY